MNSNRGIHGVKMARSTYPDESITFRKPPNRSPDLSPTSLAEYEAVFLQEWRKESLCIDQPPDLFFPEHSESNVPAKRICEMCAVRYDCLQYAIDTNQQFGIWGGTVEKERGALRKMTAAGMDLRNAVVVVELRRKGRSKMPAKEPKAPPVKSTWKRNGDVEMEETGVLDVVRVRQSA